MHRETARLEQRWKGLPREKLRVLKPKRWPATTEKAPKYGRFVMDHHEDQSSFGHSSTESFKDLAWVGEMVKNVDEDETVCLNRVIEVGH